MTSYSTRHTGDDYPTIPQPCGGKSGRQTFCSKAHYAVIAADYVMDQLVVCEVRGNPVATATCLFTLKALFERSPVPRVMQHYCQRGLLSVLVNILDTPLQSSHHHPQLVLHRLAMEILWLFSQVTSQQPATSDPATSDPTTSDPMTSDPTTSPVTKMLDPRLVSAVWRFIDPDSRFCQFSPLVARTLNEECRHARFPKQCLTSMPVTPQVWQDVALYMPWLSPCQPRPRHLLSLHTQGSRSAEGVGRKLLSEGLAWPGMPPPPPPPPPSQSEPTGQTSAPSCADPLGSGLKSGGGEGGVLCGDDAIFLNASGGHYFWVYADSEARDTAQHISQVLRAELPSLKTVHPRVGDMVIVTHGEKVHLGREGVKAAATQGERESTGRERRERVTIATQGERERREKVTVATQGERERRMKVTVATQGERERREKVTIATQGEKVDVAGVVRGRVLEVKREGVRVLAVDYGTVVRVEARCVYRPSGRASHVAAMEPQATLCRLADVHPPPVNVSTLELALALLINLTKQYTPSGLWQREGGGGMRELWRLLQVAPPGVCLLALRLTAHLAAIGSLVMATDCSPFIRPLLATLGRCMGEWREEDRRDHCVLAALYAINNLLYRKLPYRDLFFQQHGQCAVLRVVRGYRHRQLMMKAAAGVLRVLFSGLMKTLPDNLRDLPPLTNLLPAQCVEGGEESEEEGGGGREPDRPHPPPQERRRRDDSDPHWGHERTGRAEPHQPAQSRCGTEPHQPTQSRCGTKPHHPAQSQCGTEPHQPTQSRCGTEPHCSTQSRCGGEFSQERQTHLISRNYLKQEAQKLRALQEPGRRGEGEDWRQTEGTDGRDRGRGRTGAMEERWPDNDGSQSDTSSGLEDVSGNTWALPDPSLVTFDLTPVRGGSAPPDADRHYEYKSYVPFKEGSRCHFLDIDSLSSITSDHLTQLIVAMLNSEGGTIYMGISGAGCVRGVVVRRGNRELLRLAVDDVAMKTTPVVPHTLLMLRYVSVTATPPHTASGHQQGFVVEIHVKRPEIKVLYTLTLGKRKVCFHRLGTETRTLTEQDVQMMVAREEEVEYLPIILSLQQRLRDCQ